MKFIIILSTLLTSAYADITITPGQSIGVSGTTVSCAEGGSGNSSSAYVINSWCECKTYSLADGGTLYKNIEYSDGTVNKIEIKQFSFFTSNATQKCKDAATEHPRCQN